MRNTTTNPPVQTTHTSLRIVELLSDIEKAGVEEVAAHLNIAPSTAHRHLQTLSNHNYVISEAGIYRLGFKFLTVGGIVRRRVTGSMLIEDVVKELADETGERVQFVVEESGERVFLFTIAGERAVEADALIGRRGPLHCSAAGKAILAEKTDGKVADFINNHGLPVITPNTITNEDDLYDELKRIRDSGVAFNKEESTEGLRAIGTCVTGPNGSVLGGLSVSGPGHRFSGERFNEEIPDLLLGHTQALELDIKYSR